MPRGLAPRITLGLILFMLLLGAATSALVYWGFDRGQAETSARSRETLELQGRETLISYTSFQAAFGAIQMTPASDMAQAVARAIETSAEAGLAGTWDPAVLQVLPTGVSADQRPDRRTDALIVNATDEAGLRDLRDTAVLDGLVPAMLSEYPRTFPEANFWPIAVYFFSPSLTTRYYPPVGALYATPPESIDTAPLMDRVGPARNPDRRTYWTAPYTDEAGRGLVMTAYAPVYRGNELRGVVGVDISIVRLADQVDSVHPTPGGFAFYLDRGGNLLPSAADARASDPGTTSQGESTEPPPGAVALRRSINDDSNAALAALVAEMTAGAEGVGRVELDGRDYYIAYAPLPDIGGSLAIAAPVDELTEHAAVIAASVDGQGNETVLVILIAMGTLFVGALITSTWLTRRFLLAGIADLVRGTRRVAAGEYGLAIEVRSNDELGELASSFNAMSAEVLRRNDELEARVLDRTRDLEALYVQRDQRVRELEALSAIASSSTLESPLGALLDAAATRVVETTGAFSCAIGLLGGQVQSPVEIRGRSGPTEDYGDLAEALAAAMVELAAGHTVVHHNPPGSVWLVPVVYSDRLVGAICTRYGDGIEASPAELSFTEAIADQLAIAIENASLYERASATATLEERQRLARELHDSVSQALYGVGLGARTARRRLGENGPPGVVESVDYVIQLAEAGLTEMRALIFELRPEALEQEGLVGALSRQIAALEARAGVTIDATLPPEPGVPLDVKEAIYRVAQEAMNNAAKHAGATRIRVVLDSSAGGLTLTVIDNGSGFEPAAEFPGHLGLKSMRERAEIVGGLLTIESKLNEGTRVTIRISFR